MASNVDRLCETTLERTCARRETSRNPDDAARRRPTRPDESRNEDSKKLPTIHTRRIRTIFYSIKKKKKPFFSSNGERAYIWFVFLFLLIYRLARRKMTRDLCVAYTPGRVLYARGRVHAKRYNESAPINHLRALDNFQKNKRRAYLHL